MMPASLHLIMYSRSKPCPFVTIAHQVLDKYQIPYLEIFIDQDPAANQQVVEWTGFQSVPTLVLAHEGELTPVEPPSYLAPEASPRGIDRGYMITEPNAYELEQWLIKHDLLAQKELQACP